MMSYAENIFCIPENYFIVREYGMDKKWSDIVEKLDYAFQPIVNIHNGNCLGYEVLLRNYQKAGFKEINDIFDEAYNELVLFSLEIALREKAIKKFSNIGGHQKLKMFFNIDNRIITMPDYLPGATAQILKEVGLFLPQYVLRYLRDISLKTTTTQKTSFMPIKNSFTGLPLMTLVQDTQVFNSFITQNLIL